VEPLYATEAIILDSTGTMAMSTLRSFGGDVKGDVVRVAGKTNGALDKVDQAGNCHNLTLIMGANGGTIDNGGSHGHVGQRERCE
jgi:hypothetical protein